MSAGRQYLSDREWREMFEAQDFKCAARGCDNTQGPFEADHRIPNAIKPGKPDQLLCLACHAAKTREDRPVIARTKRLAGDTETQYERRKRLKAEGKHRPILGGGFPRRNRRTREEILGAF